MILAPLTALLLSAVASVPQGAPLQQGDPRELADLVLAGGRVVTVDPAGTEGQSIAMRGDRVLAVGSEAEIRRLIGEQTRVIDLEGRLAIPGFIEGHGHFLGVGDSAMQLDLRQAKTWDEIVAVLQLVDAGAGGPCFMQGQGWAGCIGQPPPKIFFFSKMCF